MIPAAVLPLLAAAGVTLSVVRTPAGYDATATYAFTGGGMSYAARDAETPRDAFDAAVERLKTQCRKHSAECNARGRAAASRTWHGRYRLLRDLRLDVLARWPIAAEVAS